MYIDKYKTLSALNISESELLMHRAAKNILYSERTDKYDIDSILEKRTMTIGLEKFLTDEQKADIISNMQKFSSLKRKLFSLIQRGVSLKNSGKDRIHRQVAKDDYGFGAVIADSALSLAVGSYKSTNTWHLKTIGNLKEKIKTLETKIKGKTKKEGAPQQRGLALSKAKLSKLEKQGHLSVWFGKKFLSRDVQDKEAYRKKRLEFFVSGSASARGNSVIRIEYSKDGKYQLKLFGLKTPISIPKSHQNTFSLDNFNRQASRIAFNSKGKLVLHITYSYIRPLKRLKQMKAGSVGIDINPNGLGICFVKNDGNPEKYQYISIGNLKDKRSAETSRLLSKEIDNILDFAAENGYNHISIEDLDFSKKVIKNREIRRLLSKFPWQLFYTLIKSKCNRRGFILKAVNPAYTSIIGIFKYSYRDNLSDAHHRKSKDLGAALVIARRGLGFRERAVVSVRGLKKKTIGISALLSLAEHKLNNINTKFSNLSLWKELGRMFYSPGSLTAFVSKLPRDG